MNFDLKRRAKNSGIVLAPSSCPICLVFLPNSTNAIKTPTSMLRAVSHSSPMPNWPDAPPKPTIAEVLIKVAPYESAMTIG